MKGHNRCVSWEKNILSFILCSIMTSWLACLVPEKR
eukprot:08632.XXX_503183_503290_1 [CDS] Oithona nana genome sequencing.